MGGVPIITEPLGLKSDLSTFSRDSLSACIRFIVSECDSAAAVLQAPDRMTDVANNLGRATKGAAMGLKCRALLYAASDLFNKPEEWAPGYTHKEYISIQDGKSQQERWEEAAAACNDFITTLGKPYGERTIISKFLEISREIDLRLERINLYSYIEIFLSLLNNNIIFRKTHHKIYIRQG